MTATIKTPLYRARRSASRTTSNTGTERLSIDHLLRLRRLSSIARLMDTAVAIPFTRVRIGADSVLGLLPGLGDAAGTLVSLYLVNEARRLGVPKAKLGQMLANVGVDFVGGAVPLLGDIFDVYFKCNKRNVDVVLDHFGLTRDDLHRRRSQAARGPDGKGRAH
jgi:hypothetical protein